MDNYDWICKIDEGMAGLSWARWAPDSRRVLTTCNFNVRLTVWSLIDRSTNYIVNPKFAEKGLSFTQNGSFMALAERKDCKDNVGIYYTGDWSLVSHFQVDSYDLQDIMWSKDNTALIVIDSVLECRFFIYSPTGNLIATHEPYNLSLGIKSFNISPNGHYLSVGFYDQTVRLYNHITWKQIIEFQHPGSINDTAKINIFKEEEIESGNNLMSMTHFNNNMNSMSNLNASTHKTTKYIEVKNNVKFPSIKPNMDKPFPSVGISEAYWSYDSSFLATKNDITPNVLFVWQISTLSLHTVIIQLKPIKNFSWSPNDYILLITTENSKLYSFTLNNVYVVELLSDSNLNLMINKITWNPNGKLFTVSDGKNLIIGQPDISDEQIQENMEEHIQGEEDMASHNEMENSNNYQHDYKNENNENQSYYNEEENNARSYDDEEVDG